MKWLTSIINSSALGRRISSVLLIVGILLSLTHSHLHIDDDTSQNHSCGACYVQTTIATSSSESVTPDNDIVSETVSDDCIMAISPVSHDDKHSRAPPHSS